MTVPGKAQQPQRELCPTCKGEGYVLSTVCPHNGWGAIAGNCQYYPKKSCADVKKGHCPRGYNGLNELDKKIQRFVAVYAPNLSMHDHAVLCEGIMNLVAEHDTSASQQRFSPIERGDIVTLDDKKLPGGICILYGDEVKVTSVKGNRIGIEVFNGRTGTSFGVDRSAILSVQRNVPIALLQAGRK